MGYHAEGFDSDFSIRRENFPRALGLLHAEAHEELRDVLAEYGFEGDFTGNGADALWWAGGNYCDSSEDAMSALAPVVEDGSYIDFIGEDHCLWRLCFEGGKMARREGRVVFD